jgi:peptide/nickel transport system permease protein
MAISSTDIRPATGSAAATSERSKEFKPRSARRRAIVRTLRNPVTMFGIICVLALFAMALAASLLPLDDPTAMDPTARRLSPFSPDHLLGTDSFGRDLLSRTVHGARLSLLMALSVVTMSTLVGILLGTLTGFLGGMVDTVVTRIWDVMLSLPGLLLLIVLMGTLGTGINTAIVALTIGSIPAAGRLVRERVIVQRRQLYVEAATIDGASQLRIMFKHVLPNSLTSVMILAALSIPEVILAEAALSYLGLGVPPPEPSWGKMIAEGQPQLLLAPWQSLIPGTCILLATLGFNLIGDGLRDILDPSSSR